MYRLNNKVQNYDWGKLGSQSKAATLCNQGTLEINEETPYAELWMGTHPNAPSLLITKQPLQEIINSDTCSKAVFDRYQDLPFLFKALSIQAHPDKELAQKLHKNFPNVYKDPNHKPEMAIALTEFEAFVGFRPLQEIVDVLHEYPELKELVGSMGNEFINTVSTTSHVGHQKQALKRLFSAIQQSSPDSRTILVQKMMKRIEHKNSRMEMLLKRLNEQYPNDVGLFCALVLNYITLQPGQAIFLAANEPHAYLCGDCIECMATSDNVIRSGFTPKFKDVDTLLDMLTYSFGSADSQITIPTPFPNTNHTLEYNPPIEEFSILFTRLKNQLESIPPIPGPSILIITNGSGWISDGTDEIQCTTGSCFFISQNVALQIHGTLDCYRAFCIINVPLS